MRAAPRAAAWRAPELLRFQLREVEAELIKSASQQERAAHLRVLLEAAVLADLQTAPPAGGPVGGDDSMFPPDVLRDIAAAEGASGDPPDTLVDPPFFPHYVYDFHVDAARRAVGCASPEFLESNSPGPSASASCWKSSAIGVGCASACLLLWGALPQHSSKATSPAIGVGCASACRLLCSVCDPAERADSAQAAPRAAARRAPELLRFQLREVEAELIKSASQQERAAHLRVLLEAAVLAEVQTAPPAGGPVGGDDSMFPPDVLRDIAVAEAASGDPPDTLVDPLFFPHYVYDFHVDAARRAVVVRCPPATCSGPSPAHGRRTAHVPRGGGWREAWVRVRVLAAVQRV
ncbi:hypothetical protein DIPPA_08557 [Diplonema papillatum]|nr:hypothetical protein DIPPA_08557 [Diplonema papillatum]